MNPNICCLKETRSVENIIDVWTQEWPGKSCWLHTLKPSANGVAILVYPKGHYEIFEIQRHEVESAICLHIKAKDIHFQILDLYNSTEE